MPYAELVDKRAEIVALRWQVARAERPDLPDEFVPKPVEKYTPQCPELHECSITAGQVQCSNDEINKHLALEFSAFVTPGNL